MNAVLKWFYCINGPAGRYMSCMLCARAPGTFCGVVPRIAWNLYMIGM